MIELYARLEADAEIDELFDAAKSHRRGRRIEAAIAALCSALLHTHAREEAYTRVADLLCDLFAQQGKAREALTLAWYLDDPQRQNQLLDMVPAADRARTYGLWAESDPKRGALFHRRGAAELEKAGLLVRAAIYYENARDIAAARALWSRLAQMLDVRRGEHYAAGLARFNLARTSREAGDERSAREATVAAVHRLEEAADRFESIGQRERAFDCYHVLIAVGELSGTFEHVLEGSVNAIRILSEDNLRYHALRMYEQALSAADKAREHAAAATLAREMTEYARKQGFGAIGARGTQRQAELWERAAQAMLDRQGPIELVENALVASLLASAEAGQYTRVGAIYRRLEELDLGASRKAHYARAAARYASVHDAPLESGGGDARLGTHVAPPDVWHVDLLEWEEHGSAVEACADVVLQPEDQNDRITRRSALFARLVALAVENAAPAEQARARVVLAGHLASVGLYALLSPLERLFESDERQVRSAVVAALSRYFYKRTFVTLEKALRDPDREVVGEATAALDRLRFEHAFDPLARIYRTATRNEVRLAALKTLARIDVIEAAELLLASLEQGGPEERDAAIKALTAARGARFVEVARMAYPQATPRLRAAIDQVLRARGLAA
jgi:hypothetical protein